MARRFFSLRVQAILFFFMVQLALFVAVFGLTGAWLMRGFVALETTQTNETIRQALKAVDNEVQELNTATGDWAAWDDLASFARTGDKGFIQRNLSTETMHTLKLNAVLILNADGQTIYARFIDLETDENLTLSGTLTEQAAPGGMLTRHKNKFDVISGMLLSTPTTGVFLSSRPILTTSQEGPPQGTLIMARLLTPALQKEMANSLNLPFSVLYGGAPDLSPEDRARFAALTAEGSSHIRRTGEDRLEALAVIPDLEGKNGAALCMELPRSTYAEGKRLYRLFAAALLAAFALLQAANALFLEQRILRRFAMLTRTVTRMAAAADTTGRVPVSGHDEIAQLGADFNQMMDSLELARQRLLDDDARLAAILDTAAEGIITMDESGAVVSFNHAAEEIFGRTAAEMRGKSAGRLLAPVPGTTPENRLLKYLGMSDNAEVRGEEVEGRRRDGATFPMRLSVSRALMHGGGSLLTMIVRDVTEEKKHLEMLKIAAAQDPLTHLLNRAHFEEHLQNAMYSARRYGHPLSLVMCDVDHFKGVNDAHGHAAGDEVLRFFADTVKTEIRANDFAGRYGGDELCFALLYADPTQAGACIDRISRKLAGHDFTGADGVSFKVTVSFGIAGLEEATTTPDQFFARADSALYEAKEHGRNRYWIA